MVISNKEALIETGKFLTQGIKYFILSVITGGVVYGIVWLGLNIHWSFFGLFILILLIIIFISEKFSHNRRV